MFCIFYLSKIRFVSSNSNAQNTSIVPSMSIYFKNITTLLLPVLFLLLAACTRNDAQREFEREAYAIPNNFTSTTFEGRVIEVDEDDWRTSPLFQGLVEITPPYPNPVTTDQLIKIEINVTGIRSVTGLDVLVRFEDNSFRNVYQDFETLEPGQSTIQVNPIEFAQFGNPEGARGLSRIYIFNGNQQMISYGDIMVE